LSFRQQDLTRQLALVNQEISNVDKEMQQTLKDIRDLKVQDIQWLEQQLQQMKQAHHGGGGGSSSNSNRNVKSKE
jgi:hypothetical protein